MLTPPRPRIGSALRVGFGVVLFAGWVIETIVWVSSTVDLAEKGNGTAVVTAVAAVALMVLLAGMEGLEVAVIDRWRELFPGQTALSLARWLAARQLFVALIVTSATLLARRSTLIVPGTSAKATSGVLASVFDLTWTGFTVLWFAQIVPKTLAATNPDAYLRLLRPTLFPLVAVVRSAGVSQPGEWVAAAIRHATNLAPAAEEQITAAALPREESLAKAWRALIPERENGTS
jgi:hypothetical protein